MEAAKIDWKYIESEFVIDQLFENINAPQWFDFLSSPSSLSAAADDDVAWFCRSDCKHPRTAEDFSKSTPSKLLRSVSVSKLVGLADWTRREATNLKKRGTNNQSSSVVNEEDNENQNPNFVTPLPPNYNQKKGGIKCSAEKEEFSEIMLESDEKQPNLKPTLSAKDLFGGKDIFGKITDFCAELKKMAAISKAKDQRDDEKQRLSSKHMEEKKTDVSSLRLEKMMNERDKEMKPLLEVKLEGGGGSKGKLKRNKLKTKDAENIPVSLDLNKIKREDKISPIRMNPPTPQGFSTTRDPIKATPSKATKSRLMGREIFQELEPNKTLKEELDEKIDIEDASLVNAKEGRTLDVFWFLKPCTL